MMRPGHALSGAAVGLWVAGVAQLGVAQSFAAAAICSGAALLPDIDNPSATVSRVFGSLSQWFSRRVNDASAAVYDLTKTARDKDRDGGHRGVTHTWPFAVAVGAGSTAAAQFFPGLLTVLFLCLSLALRGLLGVLAKRVGWLVTTATSAALTAIAAFWLPPSSTWLGILVGLGCLVHCWGDSLTLQGCPWMWPIRIRGKRWYDIATPGFLRFRAGGKIENVLVTPALILATVWLSVDTVPGGWEWVDSLG